jgi:hypothetical protein
MFGLSPAVAQEDSATCSAIVDYSMDQLASNCASLERGLTCQGNWILDSYAFNDEALEGDYGNPGDRLPLDATLMVQTGSTNLEEGLQLNVMHLDADVPAAADQGVTLIQLGGVEVENAVDAADLAAGLTPMQNFFFRTGLGDNPCPTEAPSLLFLQVPQNTTATVGIYDLPVQLNGATVVLRTVDTDGDLLPDRVELIVLGGLVVLNPDSPSPTLVAPGFITTIQLGSEVLSLGEQGDADEKSPVGDWSTPRPLTGDELAVLEILEQLPSNVIPDPVTVPGIVQASGIGGNIPVLQLPPNSPQLAGAASACAAGQLPPETCAFLGL